MKVLPKFSVNNGLAILLFIVLVIAGGVYSSGKFNQESLPKVNIPFLIVTAVYPGASAEEVQTSVAVPLENSIRNIPGLLSVVSTSADNVVTLSLEFEFDADMGLKKSEVQESLYAVGLPQQVEQPRISEVTISGGPVMYMSLRPDPQASDDFYRAVRERIVPALEHIGGVERVAVYGLPSTDIIVQLDQDKLAQYGLPLYPVIQMLQASNVIAPLGEAVIDQTRKSVLLSGNLHNIEQLGDLVIHPQPEIRLGDIASISQGTDNPQTIARYQGEPGVAIHIEKSGSANIVDVTDRISQMLDQMSGVQANILYNEAVDVKQSVKGLLREAWLGALLTSIVILLFLRNFRATCIAIISIPLSLLLTLSLLKYFTDATINILTLGALTIAIGRVVDDTIVVIENIARRMQGETLSKALVVDATLQVGKAISSSTLATIAVFIPLTFVGGYIGGLFTPFALTISFALLASLLVAVTVVPALSYLLLRRGRSVVHPEHAATASYIRVLDWSLRHKKSVISATLLFIVVSAPLAVVQAVTFLPEEEQKFVHMYLGVPRGTDIADIDRGVQLVNDVLSGRSDVVSVQSISGALRGEYDPNTYLASDGNKATWLVQLAPEADIGQFIAEAGRQLQPTVDDMNGTMDIRKLSSGPQGPDIYIMIQGATVQNVRELTEQVTAAVKQIDNTSNIRNSLTDEGTVYEVQVSGGDALRYGLTAGQAYALIQPLISGAYAGELGRGKEKAPVLVRYSNGFASAEDIGRLPLATPTGDIVEIRDIADVLPAQKPLTLQTRNGMPFAVVTGDILGVDQGSVNREIASQLQKLTLPEGTQYMIDGSSEQIRRMIGDMVMAIVVAVGLVFIVMVITFGGARVPLTILLSFPVAITGAVLANLVAGQPISIVSLIGLLMLAGIVVSNAIVFVERVGQHTSAGMGVREALLEAGRSRLRPIVMTAISTIGALVPVALGIGGGGTVVSVGLAVVVIGGLLSSTVLTLIIVPVVYEMMYSRRRRIHTIEKADASKV